MLFLRILGLVRGGRTNRVYKSRLHHERMSERTAGIRPHRFEDSTTNPVERQFNQGKQYARLVDPYPEKYKQMLTNYPYQEDQLYWWWRSQVRRELNKAAQRRELGEDVAQTSGEKLVISTSHDALTEEHPAITRPLPEFHILRPRKGR